MKRCPICNRPHDGEVDYLIRKRFRRHAKDHPGRKLCLSCAYVMVCRSIGYDTLGLPKKIKEVCDFINHYMTNSETMVVEYIAKQLAVISRKLNNGALIGWCSATIMPDYNMHCHYPVKVMIDGHPFCGVHAHQYRHTPENMILASSGGVSRLVSAALEVMAIAPPRREKPIKIFSNDNHQEWTAVFTPFDIEAHGQHSLDAIFNLIQLICEYVLGYVGSDLTRQAKLVWGDDMVAEQLPMTEIGSDEITKIRTMAARQAVEDR